MFCDTMNVLGTLPHHGEGCGPYRSIWQWWKTEDSKHLLCYLYLLVYSSVSGQRNRGLHLCIPPFIRLTPLSCPCLSAVYPHSFCLPATPVSPLCHLPFSRSRCKVMKADVRGSGRARLRDLHSQPHERFMMLTRVCGCACVCVCVSVWGVGWGGGMGLEKGNKERQRKREGGWGDKGTECETNWWSTAGLTLQPTIILTEALHIFSDATSLFI